VEEVVALVVQFVLEVGLQLFGSIGIDAATSSRRRTEKEEAGCGWLVVFAAFGAACGGLSLLVFAKPLLPANLRLVNLFVAPFVAGALSFAVARYVWTSKGQAPSHHFWRGFWFALFFGLVRFAYASR
jgi:hypothetical protein